MKKVRAAIVGYGNIGQYVLGSVASGSPTLKLPV